MNTLQILNYNQNEVRMVMQEDGPWWVLADVCKVLDISNHKNVSARLDSDEKGVHLMDTLGGSQKMTIINESGLYSVILRSDKPEAKAFKRWITHEVLPAIRRTGGYHAPISGAELLVRLAQENLAQEHRISSLERRVDALTMPVAISPTPYELPQPSDQSGCMDSMEIARILGRDHNNVLKSIRNVCEQARADGISVDTCFSAAYRRCGNNVRHRYYRVSEAGISLFCQSLKNWTLAERLRTAFSAK